MDMDVEQNDKLMDESNQVLARCQNGYYYL